MSAGLKANADGSAAIQVGGSDAITITSGLAVSMNGGAVYPITSGTAVASTSGTSIDFTGIPSTAKRITVMFSGVSLSGSSSFLIQGGAGSIENTTYTSQCALALASGGSTQGLSSTAGFVFQSGNSTNVWSGHAILTLVNSNIWICSGVIAATFPPGTVTSGGTKTFSGTLDRVRLTTVNGTDTFDAGTVNIMWE
jgi:hypothetical protein